MRLVARWGAAVVVSAAGFVMAWWICQKLVRLDEGISLAIAGAVLALILAVAAWWAPQGADSGGSVQDLDHLSDRLAEAVREQWEKEAGERRLLWPEAIPVRWKTPSAPMAGPAAAAVESSRFPPLPGLQPVDEQLLREGDIRDLHKVYGGLGSGRLVIAGAPGSGKSGAAVLLVVATLEYRKQRPESDRASVPVPVMFTLHGWDPNTQKLKDWLALQLQQTYPQLAAKRGALASELIGSSKLSVILDGLDEIPHELRPVALQALSEQANFRLLLLARSDEMASAARHQLLEGAAVVELQEVGSAEAAAYLSRIQLDPPPTGWRTLVDQIRCNPRSDLTRALASPLALTLVRDTYRSEDDICELLEFCAAAGGADSGEIAGHLLDRVIAVAYRRKPGEPPPRYSPQTAQKALRHIAVRMNQDNTRDLLWWQVASWSAAFVSTIATGLIYGILSAFLVWIPVTAASGVVAGVFYGASTGVVIGLLALATVEVVSGKQDRSPKRLVRIQWRRLLGLRPVLGGILVGIAVGSIADPAWIARLAHSLNPETPITTFPWKVSGVSVAVGAVLAGVAAGLVFGVIRGISDPRPDNASPLTPLTSWRSDRTFSIVRGLFGGFVIALALGLALGLAAGPTIGQARGLAVELVVALIYVFLFVLLGVVFGGLVVGPVTSVTWTASLAFAQLAVRWHTPIRLMRFLEDARKRGVLRTVGPIYQFRHARLQDRLAEQARGLVSPHDASKVTTI
jgi:hypothetical protein